MYKVECKLIFTNAVTGNAEKEGEKVLVALF